MTSITDKTNLEELNNMNLANLIYETEGLAWRIGHDASHGRIPKDVVKKSTAQLYSTRDQAAEILKQRTRITEHKALSDYVMSQVKKQDQIWENQWNEFSEIGTVFKFKSSTNQKLLESIGSYLPRYGTSGPSSYILFRVQGTNKINDMDNRRVTNLVKVSNEDKVISMYNDCSPLERGLIKFNEDIDRRCGEKAAFTPKWHNLDPFDQTVFYHSGFDETFEVVNKYNFKNQERSYENELIVAKSRDRPVFVEFRTEELKLITILNQKPKYRNLSRYTLDL